LSGCKFRLFGQYDISSLYLGGHDGTAIEGVDAKCTINVTNAIFFPESRKVFKDPQTENWTHFLNRQRGFTKVVRTKNKKANLPLSRACNGGVSKDTALNNLYHHLIP
jgi:hypothetical protein